MRCLGPSHKIYFDSWRRKRFQPSATLLKDEKPSYVLADRGYDSDEIVNYIKEINAISVIPPRSNRLIQREYDKIIYKDRNLIERLFNRIKQFRKIATRFEKIKINFEALLYLACSYLWLT